MKKKIIILEPEMLRPKGHFLDHLIELTLALKKKHKVIWVLNSNFNSEGKFIPKKIKILKTIQTNKFDKKNQKFLYLFNEIYILLKSFYDIIFLLIYFFFQKKTYKFIKALSLNFFLLPRSFKGFYFSYIKSELKPTDHVIIPSCRKKHLELIRFLSNIKDNLPKFHFRIFLPPKEKFRGFYFHIKKLKKFFISQQFYLYTFGVFSQKLIQKNLNYKIDISLTNLPYSFFSRRTRKNFTIGYLGEARFDKGFHLLPNLISLLEKKRLKLNYIIQFTNTSKQLYKYKNQLIDMAKLNPRIKIIEQYCDYLYFRKLLKKIDIMPILYNIDQLNKSSSGIVYSCATYEIPTVIPNRSNFLLDLLKNKSYEKYIGLNDCCNKIVKITKSYEKYLDRAKKNSLILKKVLSKDPLKLNIN